MERYILKSVFFDELKGLSNIEISFSETLTAIMGVNGSGKSTVIHALACLYRPDGNGENHKFPEFFVPNSDSLWNGSKLHVTNETEDSSGRRITLPPKEYGKPGKRWQPRYDSRPKRNVYYIGIDTCLPDIEKKSVSSRILFDSELLTDKMAKKETEISAYILNKSYQHLYDNTYNKKHFPGVELSTGLKYSSLSMGSGEQRVIKIINVLLNAEPCSLVLIDEIDLLLHVSSLRRLIEKVHELSSKRNIQVVFTTHSLEMMTLRDYVKIQYISNYGESHQSLVFDEITADLVYSMTGKRHATHSIFVEDSLAQRLIVELARRKGVSSAVEVVTYGSIENAFSLAAGFVIEERSPGNNLIVMDGDKYETSDKKEAQIKKRLTGTEGEIKGKHSRALGFIREFDLPDGCPPEKFLHDVILRCFPHESEVFLAASEIHAVGDSHDWIGGICKKLGCDISYVVREIFEHSCGDGQFNKYVKSISEWMDENCRAHARPDNI